MKPPLVEWSISIKERGNKPNKIPSLEKPFPIVTTSFDMEVACVIYKVIDTFYLWKECNTDKGGPFVPFVVHTMLAHQWENCQIVGEDTQKPLS